MAMDDVLKIILTADLDENSVSNITEKINNIKKHLTDMKIKITEEGNFTENISKLVKNLETLNKTLAELSEQQVKSLKNIREQSQKNAKDITEDLNKEKKAIKEVNAETEHLLKTKLKAGNTNTQTKTYGNANKQTTVVHDTDTGEELSRQIALNNKKATDEKKKYEELSNRISKNEGEQTKQQREFLAVSQKLDINSKDYVKNSEKAGQLYDTLIAKEKILDKLLEHRAKLEAKSKELKEKGYDKKVTDPLDTAINKTLSQDKVFGKTGRQKSNYEEEYAKAIKDSNEALKKSEQIAKNVTRIEEAKADARKRASKLEEKGFDTSGIGRATDVTHLNERQSEDTVRQNVSALNDQLKAMEKADKLFDKIDDKLKRMGITLDRSFKNLGATGDLEHLNAEIESLQNRINEAKARGLSIDESELQVIQQTLTELQNEAQIRQNQAREDIANERAEKRFKGDRVEHQNFQQEQVQQVFQDDSYTARSDNARSMARDYLEQAHGVDNLNEANAQLTSTLDRLNRETFQVSYAVEQTNGEMRTYTVAIDEATGAMYHLENASNSTSGSMAHNRGVLESIGESLRRVPAYLGSFELIYGAFSQIQESFRILYEVDQAMTDLQKVTDATGAEFEAFRVTASEMGKELGATTSEVVNAIANFQKLGYNFKQSQDLGQTALVYANVGDTDVNDASESLISALSGFQVAQKDVAEESKKYVDIFNEVGNKYAVSSAGIGEALKRSSAVMSDSGNTIEESVGMIAGANKVIQDEAKVGTALKTIGMRLRGVDEETGDTLKLLPKLEGSFESVGLTVKDSAGGFKDMYDILGDLAKIWNTGQLTELQKADFVEQIAGKHHATVLSGLLNNWQETQSAVKTAQNSMGSAEREFAVYQQSMVYRVDQLRASYEEFWLTFWNEDSVKGAISGLTKILEIMTNLIESLGSLSVVGGAIVPMILLFSKTFRTTFLTGTVQAIAFRAELQAQGLTWETIRLGINSATVALRSFAVAMGIGLLIGAGIELIIKLYDKLSNSQSEVISKLGDQYEAQKKITDQLQTSPQFDMQRYTELEHGDKAKTNTPQEAQQYKEMQDYLKTANPEFVQMYDQQGNAILKTAEALSKLNDERREELKLIGEKKVKAEKQQDKGSWLRRNILEQEPIKTNTWLDKTNIPDPISAITKIVADPIPTRQLEDTVAKAKESRDELNKVNKDISGMKLGANIISDANLQDLTQNTSAFKTKVQEIQEQLSKLRNKGDISQGDYNQLHSAMAMATPDNIDDVMNKINSYKEKLRSDKKDLVDELGKTNDDVDKAFQEVEDTINEDYNNFLLGENIQPDTNKSKIAEKLKDAYIDALKKGQFQDTEKAYDEFGKNMSEAMGKIDTGKVDLGALATGGQDAVNILQTLSGTMKGSGDMAVLFGNSLTLAKDNLAGMGATEIATVNTTTAYRNELSTAMGTYTERATMLAETLKMVNHGEALSVDQVNNLTTLYPSLNKAIETHNGVLSIKSSALLKVMKDEENNTKSTISNIKTRASAQIKEVQAFIDGKEAQVKSIDALQKADVKSTSTDIYRAAGAVARARYEALAKKNAKLDPLAQMSDRELESHYNSYYSQAFNQMESSAHAQIADLQGLINMLDSLHPQDFTKNINNKVDPPKADKAGGGAKDQEKATEQLMYVTDRYKDKMRELNDELRKHQDLMEQYPEYSKKYQTELRSEISTIREKIKEGEREEANLQKQIDTKTIQKTGLVKVGEQTIGGGGGGGATRTTSTLRVGSRGEAVKQLQRKLGIKADGIFGNQTASAVRNYQRSHHLGVDGVVGRQTLTSLGMYGASTVTSGAVAGATTRTLRVGSRGEDVKALQRKLGITADGIFGNQTARAVRSYQSKHGLSADSIAGKNTLTAMGLYGKGAGGVDTKNAQAKLQEAIDQTKDSLSSVASTKSADRKTLNAEMIKLFEATTAGIEHDAKAMEDDLAKLDFNAEKLLPDSNAWRENRQERLSFLKTQEAGSIEAIANLQKELTASENTLNEKLQDGVYDMMDTQRVNLIKTQKEIYDLQKEIESSVINEIMSGYQDEMDNYDNEISKISTQMGKISDTDLDKYAEKSKEITQIIKTQIETNKVRLAQLKAEEQRVKPFPDLYKEWQKNVKDLTNAQEDLNKALYDQQKEILDRQESAIDDLIDSYKSYYQQQEDMELEALDKMSEAEDKAHDERLKRWDKELQAFQDNVDKQLQALDEAESERAYQQDLTQKQTERQKVIDTIGLVSLDTSQEGRARLRQLQDQLKTMTDEINNSQHQRQVEARQKALNDQLEARSKENDKLQESEDERYDKEQKALEEHQKEIEKKWENIIENERYYARLRENLLAGNTSEMTSQVDSFVTSITTSSDKMGKAISQNLIDKFQNARKELVELDGVLDDSQLNFNEEYGSTSNNWYKGTNGEGLVTQDMIDNATLNTPNVYYIYQNPQNPANTSTPASQITVTMNVGTVTGGQEGADTLVKAVADGLASKGVTLG